MTQRSAPDGRLFRPRTPLPFGPATTRRGVLAGGLALGAAAVPLAMPALAQTTSGLQKLRLAWSGTGICLVSIPVAQHKGFFAKHGLDVEFINFGSSIDQMLEGIATGKADAGVNFILRYLKPLEQGINIRFTAALHGGCIRLLSPTGSEVKDVVSLKGKTIGVTDLSSAAKNYYSILLDKAGINPNTEVNWKVYPADLFDEALRKGDVDAVTDADPGIFLVLQRGQGKITQIGSNLDGEYRNLSCCVIAARKEFVETDRPRAAALTRALIDAAEWVSHNQDEAAEVFTKYSPVPRETLATIIRSHTHEHHLPANPDLKREIAYYIEDMKRVGILKPRTDPKGFADKIVVDVLG